MYPITHNHQRSIFTSLAPLACYSLDKHLAAQIKWLIAEVAWLLAILLSFLALIDTPCAHSQSKAKFPHNARAKTIHIYQKTP